MRRSASRRYRPLRTRHLAIEALESRHLLAADFGDARAPFATTLVVDGARHEAVGPVLGALRDAENDGTPSPAAAGDDVAGGPSYEDGVSFSSLRTGQLGGVIVVEVSNAPAGAKLDAWIDFNGDGSWGGPSEQIASSLPVSAGDNVLHVDVPAFARVGDSIARFRLSTAGVTAPGGYAADGEVEDHVIAIQPPNVSGGVFSPPRLIAAAPSQNARQVRAADMDGDGDLDLLATAKFGPSLSASFEIAWFENRPSGLSRAFTVRRMTAVGGTANPNDAVPADVDGLLDVIEASYYGKCEAIHTRAGCRLKVLTYKQQTFSCIYLLENRAPRRPPRGRCVRDDRRAWAGISRNPMNSFSRIWRSRANGGRGDRQNFAPCFRRQLWPRGNHRRQVWVGHIRIAAYCTALCSAVRTRPRFARRKRRLF